jgi:hypothetical protein
MAEGIIIRFSNMLNVAQTVGIVGTNYGIDTFFLKEANTESVNRYTN